MSTSRAKNPKQFPRLLKYTGELAQPIFESNALGIDPNGRKREARLLASVRQAKKLGRLMNWYGIDPDSEESWYSLAFALAVAHVPGLRVIHAFKPIRGRKRSWKAGLGTALQRDVEKLQTQQRISMSAAIRLLRKDRTKQWHQYTEQNLVTRHREARRATRSHTTNR